MDEKKVNDIVNNLGKHVEMRTTTGRTYRGTMHIVAPTGHVYYIDDNGHPCVLSPGIVEHIRQTTTVVDITDLLHSEEMLIDAAKKKLKEQKEKSKKGKPRNNKTPGYE